MPTPKRAARTPRPRNQATPTPTPAAAPPPMTDLLIAAHTADTFRLIDTWRIEVDAFRTDWLIAANAAAINAREDGIAAVLAAAEATHLGTAGAFDAALVAVTSILPGVLGHYVRLAKGVVQVPDGLGGHGTTMRLPRALTARPAADPYDPGLLDRGAATGPIYDGELIETGEFHRTGPDQGPGAGPGQGMEPAYRVDPADVDVWAKEVEGR